MNDVIYTAQLIGVVSIFILTCIAFFIAIHEPSFKKSGRVVILWITIYIFFLFALRLVQLLGLASSSDLRIVSGFSTVIPTVSVIIHLLTNNKEPSQEALPSIQEARAMLVEAKEINIKAKESLNKATKTNLEKEKK